MHMRSVAPTGVAALGDPRALQHVLPNNDAYRVPLQVAVGRHRSVAVPNPDVVAGTGRSIFGMGIVGPLVLQVDHLSRASRENLPTRRVAKVVGVRLFIGRVAYLTDTMPALIPISSDLPSRLICLGGKRKTIKSHTASSSERM